MWVMGVIVGVKLFWVGASVVFIAALFGSGDDASLLFDVFELVSVVDGLVYGDFFSVLSLGVMLFFLWGFV